MEIKEAREGEVLVLTPDGSLGTAEECAVLEGKLAGVPAKTGKAVVLDCQAVGQLTSAALRALLLASRKLALAKGRLVICSGNAKVRKALAISGFDRDLTVVGTREEAVRRALEPVAPASARRHAAVAPRERRVVPGQPPGPVAAAPEPPPAPRVAAPSDAPPSAVRLSAPSHDALAAALLDALGGGPPGKPAPAPGRSLELDALAAAVARAMTPRLV